MLSLPAWRRTRAHRRVHAVAMPDNPWEMLARSQRAAVGLVADSVTTMVEMGKAGVTRPEDVLTQVTALASAVGDLAGSTARPLEVFLESQRQLAETMSAFAVLQRQLADVMDTAATNHAAIVQALEMMTAPVMTVAQRVRSTTDPDEDAKGSTTSTGDKTTKATKATKGKTTKSKPSADKAGGSKSTGTSTSPRTTKGTRG